MNVLKNLCVLRRGWIYQGKINRLCTSKFSVLQESLINMCNKMLLLNFIRNSVLDRMGTEAKFLTKGKGNQGLLKIYEDMF